MLKLAAPCFRHLAGLLLILLAGRAYAQGPNHLLQGIDFVAQQGDSMLLTLTVSDGVPEPTAFTIDSPARLSIDLPDTAIALDDPYRKIGMGNVESVAAVQAAGRTRIVVELREMAPYHLRREGNKLYVEIDNPVAAPASTSSASLPAISANNSAISNIDFRRGEQGQGRIVVSMSNPHTMVDVRDDDDRIVAVFRNTSLPEKLAHRLDVIDFATPVKYIDTKRDGPDTQLIVTPTQGASFDQAAYQSGGLYTIELQPLTQAKLEERQRNEPQYKGEKISLSFQNIDIRALLQIIADVAGTNMVISDSVKGNIAMRLQNVPWDQALDIILRSKGLGMRQQGNVMMVAPVEEIAAREKAELEAEKQKTELAPLRSEIIQVNYAKASDIKALLGSDKTSLLSDRGRVTVDERTNTLLVLETQDKIAEIRKLVARLDIPVRQVLIESRIVIANEDYARELGTKFGVSTIGSIGNTQIGQSGTATGARNVLGGTTPLLDDAYSVNLPTSDSGAPSIGWTILGSDFQVDLELQALQTEGRGEVISSPRVVTANGKQATIEQGQEIPYQTSSSNSGTNTQFKKAVLSLTVAPQITPDNRVIMDLNVTNDSKGTDVNTGTGGTAPAIDTRKLDTQVLVRSGDTVVLGGVFQHSTTDSTSKVPLLGDIPLLGFLFRNSDKEDSKRELLIFVTPKVLQEGLKVD
ncbi:type IV pilus secretin PilQ [Solimonas marina]|uniref:Type IV pilus secretin PilQ n=1 Tax=Solimonas marina TaxID=2714601 RepID=A0A969W7U8_9GAMM|nr:type IV pilus secretin PilQ [Solimonas marina]NKF21160.1 type IV pilus secretin PilQ [Solimonas marina]